MKKMMKAMKVHNMVKKKGKKVKVTKFPKPGYKTGGKKPCVFLSSNMVADAAALGQVMKDFWRTTQTKDTKIHIVGLFDAKPKKDLKGKKKEKIESVKELKALMGLENPDGTHEYAKLYTMVVRLAKKLKKKFKLSFVRSGYRFDQEQKPDEIQNFIRKCNTKGSIIVAQGGNTHVLARAMQRAPSVRKALHDNVLSGKLLYVGFSAGTCYAGATPAIARDPLPKDMPNMIMSGLKLVNLHMRPHCPGKKQSSWKKGREIEEKQRCGTLKDDKGNKIDVPVVYMKDKPKNFYAVLHGKVHPRTNIWKPNKIPDPWR